LIMGTSMSEDAQLPRTKRPKRRPLVLASAVLLGLVIAAVVPPLLSMNSYKGRITHLMAESLGRPVRLSSVELHLLPVPAFILTDLTVAEDPAYGSEPVLKANTVTASIRLLSLWRGRLEISKVSVDEASLNIVRTDEGRWNLDPIFRTAAQSQTSETEQGTAPAEARHRPIPLPYLEATSLRINFKRGAEKLPFSLVDSDLSFWQEQPGDWRIRLRAQPARTDVSLDLADTGLVRLEARAQRAPELRQIPIHMDLEWREAQLGQLSRLLVGSDPGWRGDLTGELHLDGTPDAANIKTRLRATGVHRAEFAPKAPMDFDATCGFLYHFSARTLENLACDSPLGDGRIHIAGAMPGNAPPNLSVELDKIPVAATLDALRTVRSGFGPGLEAAGTVSGKITYAAIPPQAAPDPAHAEPGKSSRNANIPVSIPGPLTGSLTVEGFQLSGDGLTTPIQAAKLVLSPVPQVAQNQPPANSHSHGSAPPSATVASATQPSALEATVTIPAGAPTPLSVNARVALSGYQFTVRGQAAIARARELAHFAGIPHADALGSLSGDLVTVDLAASGPWQPPLVIPFANGVSPAPPGTSDTLTGTITLHNSIWKPDYLANRVQISQAVLNLDSGNLRWDPVVFAYGPVKGTASLIIPAHCDPTPAIAPQPCLPTFDVHFPTLDAAALQAAMLGAQEQGTLLSSLLARLKPSDASTPAWPPMQGKVSADAFLLGPFTLANASANLHITARGAEFTALDASALGGTFHGSGTFEPATAQAKPAYSIEARFDAINPAKLGQILSLKCTGTALQADGKITLNGFTANDLSASAKGTLHFEWRRGSFATQPAEAAPALAHFDRWEANAAFGNGALTFGQNELQQGSRKSAVAGSLTLADPPKITLNTPKAPHPKP
jgi:AsmA family